MAKASKEVTREQIHSGLSGLREDSRWSDVLDFRFCNSRTNIVPPFVLQDTTVKGLHTLIKGPNGNHYAIGSKGSYLLKDSLGDVILKPLWDLRHSFIGDRNMRESKNYQLKLKGRYTGTEPKKVRVTLLRELDLYVEPPEPEVEVETIPYQCEVPIVEIPVSESFSFDSDGGDGIFRIALGQQNSFGDYALIFNPLNVPDRLQAYLGTDLVADTGYVGGLLPSYPLVGEYTLDDQTWDGTGYVVTGQTTITVTAEELASADESVTRATGSPIQVGVDTNYPFPTTPSYSSPIRLLFSKQQGDLREVNIVVTGTAPATAWNLDIEKI